MASIRKKVLQVAYITRVTLSACLREETALNIFIEYRPCVGRCGRVALALKAKEEQHPRSFIVDQCLQERGCRL